MDFFHRGNVKLLIEELHVFNNEEANEAHPEKWRRRTAADLLPSKYLFRFSLTLLRISNR